MAKKTKNITEKIIENKNIDNTQKIKKTKTLSVIKTNNTEEIEETVNTKTEEIVTVAPIQNNEVKEIKQEEPKVSEIKEKLAKKTIKNNTPKPMNLSFNWVWNGQTMCD